MSRRENVLWSDARILLPLALALVASALMVAGIARRAQYSDALQSVGEIEGNLLGLANELRHSSDALTRWSRSAVVTGDPRYRRLLEESLEVRAGKRARPASRVPMYWNLREFSDIAPDESGPRAPFLSLVAAAGATHEELALLEISKDASEKLVVMERAAIDLAATGESSARNEALSMLHDGEYTALKSQVMTPVARFAAAVQQRSLQRSAVLEASIDRADRLIAVATMSLLLALGLTWIGFRRLFGAPFATLIGQIHALRLSATDTVEVTAEARVSLAQSLRDAAQAITAKDERLERLLGALRAEETRLRQLVEHAPVALALFDTGMHYLAFSQRWLSAYGLEGRELLGRSHYEIFPEIPET